MFIRKRHQRQDIICLYVTACDYFRLFARKIDSWLHLNVLFILAYYYWNLKFKTRILFTFIFLLKHIVSFYLYFFQSDYIVFLIKVFFQNSSSFTVLDKSFWPPSSSKSLIMSSFHHSPSHPVIFHSRKVFSPTPFIYSYFDTHIFKFFLETPPFSIHYSQFLLSPFSQFIWLI